MRIVSYIILYTTNPLVLLLVGGLRRHKRYSEKEEEDAENRNSSSFHCFVFNFYLSLTHTHMTTAS
jgi:hypothetical protein